MVINLWTALVLWTSMGFGWFWVSDEFLNFKHMGLSIFAYPRGIIPSYMSSLVEHIRSSSKWKVMTWFEFSGVEFRMELFCLHKPARAEWRCRRFHGGGVTIYCFPSCWRKKFCTTFKGLHLKPHTPILILLEDTMIEMDLCVWRKSCTTLQTAFHIELGGTGVQVYYALANEGV